MRHPRPQPAPTDTQPHLDHSCVARAEYDDALHALGHAEARIRDLDQQICRLANENLILRTLQR